VGESLGLNAVIQFLDTRQLAAEKFTKTGITQE
jgi:hypothetical protein